MHKIKKDDEEVLFTDTKSFVNYIDYISIYDEKLDEISFYIDPDMVDSDEEYLEIIRKKDKNFNFPECCKNRYDFREMAEASATILAIQTLFSGN